MWHKGRTWFLGDDVDTDQIMPTRYLALRTAQDLGRHALSGNDPAWPERIAAGDMLVAGANFGCGSSREHAPLGLKGMGLACVIAQSFSRIFYRNAVNVGLPLLVVKAPIAERAQGRDGWVDLEAGRLSFDGGGTALDGTPPAPIVLSILAAGGLMQYVAGRGRAVR
ncbi:MAG: 3-isopropylmalate dehydratase [Burkholderiales bacterium]